MARKYKKVKRLNFPKIDGKWEIITQEDFAKIKSKEVGRVIHPTTVMNAIKQGRLDYTLPIPTDPARDLFEAWANNTLTKKGLNFYIVYNEKAISFLFGKGIHRQKFVPTPLPFPTMNGLEIIDIPEFIYRKTKQFEALGLQYDKKTDASLFSYYEQTEDLQIVVPSTFLAKNIKRFILWNDNAKNLFLPKK